MNGWIHWSLFKGSLHLLTYIPYFTATVNELRMQPALPNSYRIDKVEVTKTTVNNNPTYEITLTPFDCGYNFPTFQSVSGQVKRKLMTTFPHWFDYLISFFYPLLTCFFLHFSLIHACPVLLNACPVLVNACPWNDLPKTLCQFSDFLRPPPHKNI